MKSKIVLGILIADLMIATVSVGFINDTWFAVWFTGALFALLLALALL